MDATLSQPTHWLISTQATLGHRLSVRNHAISTRKQTDGRPAGRRPLRAALTGLYPWATAWRTLADGADVQSYLLKCLVSVDRGPPDGGDRRDGRAVAYETSVVAEPPRLAPRPRAGAGDRAVPRRRRGNRTAAARGRRDLRDELAETERRLVRAVRDVEDLECEIKSRPATSWRAYRRAMTSAFGRIGRPPAAAMPVFMCLCRLVFPDEKLKDRNTMTRTGRSCGRASCGTGTPSWTRCKVSMRTPTASCSHPEQYSSRSGRSSFLVDVATLPGDAASTPTPRSRACRPSRRSAGGPEQPRNDSRRDRIEALDGRSKSRAHRGGTFRRTRHLRSTAGSPAGDDRNRIPPLFALAKYMSYDASSQSALGSRAARKPGNSGLAPATCRHPSRGSSAVMSSLRPSVHQQPGRRRQPSPRPGRPISSISSV